MCLSQNEPTWHPLRSQYLCTYLSVKSYDNFDVSIFGLAGAVVADNDGANTFITEPADAVVAPGEEIQLDCELVEEDICAWRLNDTNLDVDHFYNAAPPPKVHALFPDHERVCSIIISDIDHDYDGYWTCWPLGEFSHFSSRAARITVSGRFTAPATPST